mgnify:CR=1 FL=1
MFKNQYEKFNGWNEELKGPEIWVENYSTVIDSDSRDVKKLSIGFTIEISSNQLNKYNYTKKTRIITEPQINNFQLDY